jgi:hypothetical protein
MAGEAAKQLDIYKIDEEEQNLIMEATNSSGVDIKTRNKLYAALNRALQKPTTPAHAIARWAEDSKEQKKKFKFLQEWVKDTTFGQMKIVERNVHGQDQYLDTQFAWVTRVDLMVHFRGFENPEGKAHVDKLIAGAKKSKFHPLFPKDTDMKLHRVLGSLVDGVRASSRHERGYEIEAAVNEREAGEMVMAATSRAEAMMGKVDMDVDEMDNGTPKPKRTARKRPVGEETKDKETGEPPKKTRKAKANSSASNQKTKAEEYLKVVHDLGLNIKILTGGVKKQSGRHNTMLLQSLQGAAEGLKGVQDELEAALVSQCADDVVERIWQQASPALKIAEEEVHFTKERLKSTV